MRTELFQRFADRFPTERLARSRMLRGVWRVALATLRPEEVTMRLADYRMVLPVGHKSPGRGIVNRGTIERAATDAFRAMLRPGMTVVDIGANVGHYTLIAALAVGPTGSVVAFEPDFGVSAMLRRNAKLNELNNIVIVEQAVSSRNGGGLFYVDGRNPGGHSLIRANAAAPGPARPVPTVRLDTYFAGRTIDVMKIDAQGAEAWIIDGAEHVLRRSNTSILLEMWPYGLAQCEADAVELLAHLEALGYTPRRAFVGRRTIDTDVTEHVFSVARERDNPNAALDVLLEPV